MQISVHPRPSGRTRSRFSKLITRSVVGVIVERHTRVRADCVLPVRLAHDTVVDLDELSFTVLTVDAAGEAVSHHIVLDREGHVRRIVTPS